MILKAVFIRYIAPILLSIICLILGLIIFLCSLVAVKLIDKKVKKVVYYTVALGLFMILTSTWWVVSYSIRAQKVVIRLSKENEVRSAGFILLQQIAIAGERCGLFSLANLLDEANIIIKDS